MSNIKFAGLVAVMVLTVPCAASAQGFTGVELYKTCNGVDGLPRDDVICLAYIRGFVDGMSVGVDLAQSVAAKGRRTCFPTPSEGKQIDPTQAELIIKKFLADNPGRLQEPAQFLAFDALVAVFACEPKP
jgi:hypothetical protein